MTKDFHKKPFDDETILKLEIFKGYIREWLPVFLFKNSFHNINILDFFAGPGRDCKGRKGSPLIIIDEIKQYLENPNLHVSPRSDLAINVLFNDFDKNKIDSLRKEIEQETLINIKTSNYNFKESFELQRDVLESKIDAKLVIMDQTGIKHITHGTFRELINFPALDFMFFISSSYLKRFITLEEVKQYFPTMSVDEVKKIHSTDIHRFVCDYYQKLVPPEKDFYIALFSIKKGANIYGIIFGSSILLGLEKFLKVCWYKDKVSGEANYDIDNDIIRNGESLFPDMNISNKLNYFEKSLIKYLEVFKNNNEIYRFTLENGCLPKHAGEILKNIQKDNRLVAEPPDIKKGSFYLSWDYYRKKEIKVKFRIK